MDVDEDDLEGKPRKLSTARKVRMAIVFTLAGLAAFAIVYTRFIVKKEPLGGPCKYAFQCGKDAPKCLRPSEDADGICSRLCEPGTDCADGIRCKKVDLEERDDRGMPLQGGYCLTDAFLDAQNPGKKKHDSAFANPASSGSDALLDVPNVPGQLEAELDLHWEKVGAPPSPPKTFAVKGSLLLLKSPGHTRTIVDTSSLRLFIIDDDKKSFSASVIEAPQTDDVKITKTADKAKVADHDCDIWKIEEPKATREVCVVPGAALVDPRTRAPAWVKELAVRGVFPLRVIERDATGKEVVRMTTTRFDAHPIDATLFNLPKTYRNLAAK